MDAFEQGPWGRRFPTVVAAWRRAWDRVIPFFAFAPALRRVLYTTNAIESVHARLRKIIKTRGHFPSDEAATKLIWLALRNITADWGRAAKEWREAMNQFAIAYGDRFTRGVMSAVTNDFPTAPLASRLIRAGCGAMEKSPSASHTKIRTPPTDRQHSGPGRHHHRQVPRPYR